MVGLCKRIGGAWSAKVFRKEEISTLLRISTGFSWKCVMAVLARRRVPT